MFGDFFMCIKMMSWLDCDEIGHVGMSPADIGGAIILVPYHASSLCHLFDDRAPVETTILVPYLYIQSMHLIKKLDTIFKWDALTLHKDRAPG